MPINVLAHDLRLEGAAHAATSSTVSIVVDGSTPISDFFDGLRVIIDSRGDIGILTIMCHGVRLLAEQTTGLLFCHELITNFNVDLFQQIQGHVDRIVIFACHAAETDLSDSGDGDELCRTIAINTQAEVTAAREDQAYYRPQRWFGDLFMYEDGQIEFGEWEGPVVVYGRDGRIIARFNNPSVWYDADRRVHDPRAEPRPGVWYDASGHRHERY